MTTDELPLPGYDELPEGTIEARIRSLDHDGVQQVLDYERCHAARPAIIQIIEHRAQELADGAEPTPGAPDAFAPGPRLGTTAAEEAARIEGPPINPPPDGEPSGPSSNQL
ncbi:hypothetical protein [Nocardioides terrisoli]|uniref:hypothetical protein n=1 Tax=Nocardioides terrisoli TaxID=3388267 RepID=UPI00287B783E|nr:hypothetical protein [Nocardioides marmorisolisilvae]